MYNVNHAGAVVIVMECAQYGSLMEYVKGFDKNDIPEKEVLLIMLQICLGVQFLHNKKTPIIHRDIQHANILITKNGIAKITDFGLSSDKKYTQLRKEFYGYNAPEFE